MICDICGNPIAKQDSPNRQMGLDFCSRHSQEEITFHLASIWRAREASHR